MRQLTFVRRPFPLSCRYTDYTLDCPCSCLFAWLLLTAIIRKHANLCHYQLKSPFSPQICYNKQCLSIAQSEYIMELFLPENNSPLTITNLELIFPCADNSPILVRLYFAIDPDPEEILRNYIYFGGCVFARILCLEIVN